MTPTLPPLTSDKARPSSTRETSALTVRATFPAQSAIPSKERRAKLIFLPFPLFQNASGHAIIISERRPSYRIPFPSGMPQNPNHKPMIQNNRRHKKISPASALPATVVEREVVPCPTCGKPAIHSGTRKTKQGAVQKYFCVHCKSYFSNAPIPRRRYSPAVILSAITAYNLGSTLDATRGEIARRFKVAVPQSTLHAWLNQFSNICTFIRYRRKFSLGNDAIVSHVFRHNDQEYRFKFHRLKTNMFSKDRFPELRRYLWRVSEECPNKLFSGTENGRCSEMPVKTQLLAWRRPDNNAVALAKLGLLLAKRATLRHEAVEHFMLANDTATVAVEIPVWLYPNEAPDLKLASPVTGHIDILQVRGNYLYILDFKPDARHETKARHQLALYARALSARTGIPASHIRSAYFDNKDYFEVVPATNR